jgi:glutaredoxin 3
MKPITVYMTPNCGYCLAVRSILREAGFAFEEIDVSADPARRGEMIALTGGRMSTPQVFVGDRLVGGWDELDALDRSGRLRPLVTE